MENSTVICLAYSPTGTPCVIHKDLGQCQRLGLVPSEKSSLGIGKEGELIGTPFLNTTADEMYEKGAGSLTEKEVRIISEQFGNYANFKEYYLASQK